jgi:hypothetical protein
MNNQAYCRFKKLGFFDSNDEEEDSFVEEDDDN